MEKWVYPKSLQSLRHNEWSGKLINMTIKLNFTPVMLKIINIKKMIMRMKSLKEYLELKVYDGVTITD